MKVTLKDGSTIKAAVGDSLIGYAITSVTLTAEDFKSPQFTEYISHSLSTRIVQQENGTVKKETENKQKLAKGHTYDWVVELATEITANPAIHSGLKVYSLMAAVQAVTGPINWS